MFFLLVALFAFSADSHAKSFRAEVSPKTIRPGDVFFVRLSNLRTSQAPSALFEDHELYFSSCGKGCYIAIGAAEIKSKPKSYTVRLRIGRKKRNLKISVRRTKFPVQHLSLPEDKVILSPENVERTKREEERLAAIFGTVSNRLWDGRFMRPLDNELSTAFGTERIMNEKWISIHRGIDIKGNEGEDVRASNDGKVVLAEELYFEGNTVIIDHGDGIYTVYMHLSKMQVSPGDFMSKGDLIGLVGSSGRSTGPHLHFGVKVTGISVNPVSLTRLSLPK